MWKSTEVAQQAAPSTDLPASHPSRPSVACTSGGMERHWLDSPCPSVPHYGAVVSSVDSHCSGPEFTFGPRVVPEEENLIVKTHS